MEQIDDKERACRVAISQIMGVGTVTFRRWKQAFAGEMARLWGADRSVLEKRLGKKAADLIGCQKKKVVDPLELYCKMRERGWQMVLLGVDELYPPGIAVLDQPPQVLYVRGELTEADERSIAVVGTRRPSAYGEEVTRLLVADLVAFGYTIVSGLAFGIDAVAHRAALAAGGRTVGFLASGIDLITPTEHEALAMQITKHGALLSAFSPGQCAFRGNFVARNRLVAGMSRGVLVPEGGVNSGTWLTAQFGLDQHKSVMAVPGQITSILSKGPHQLVRAGASLVTSVADIVELLEGEQQQTTCVREKPLTLTDVQSVVWGVLETRGRVTTDDLTALVGKPVNVIMAELTIMEMNGWVICRDHEWVLAA